MSEGFEYIGPPEPGLGELQRRADEYHAPDPAEQPEPSGREAILEALAEEAKRESRGEPSVCVRCTKVIKRRVNLYRCAECGMPFHLSCIRAHFAEHQEPEPSDEPGPIEGVHYEVDEETGARIAIPGANAAPPRSYG